MNLGEKVNNLKKISKLVIDTMNKYNIQDYMLYYNLMDLSDDADTDENIVILKLYIPDLNEVTLNSIDNDFSCLDYTYTIHLTEDLSDLVGLGYRRLLAHHVNS